jgi:hypothetical protein
VRKYKKYEKVPGKLTGNEKWRERVRKDEIGKKYEKG